MIRGVRCVPRRGRVRRRVRLAARPPAAAGRRPRDRRRRRARDLVPADRRRAPRRRRPLTSRPPTGGPATGASAASSASSVGVEPRPSRAPTRAASGGSRNVDARVGQAGLGEDLGRRSVEDDPALAHHDDPLERLGDEAHVVADRDDRPAGARTGRRRSAGCARRRARPGRSSARRGRRPACPSRGSRPGRAASAASSRGRTGSSGRPCRGRSRERRVDGAVELGARAARGCAARTRPRPGPCRRRSGDPGPGTRARRVAARCGDPPAGRVDAVDEDPALGRPEQAVEVADERRLSASRSGRRSPPARRRAIARSTPSSARVPPGRRGRAPPSGSRRGRSAAVHRGCVPPARCRPRRRRARGRRAPGRAAPAPAARRRARPAAGRRRPRPSVRRARSGRRRSRRSALHSPSRRSVLCSAIRSDVPGLGQRPERLADEPRPCRVELGASARRGSCGAGRIARSEAIPTSWACPPDSRCGSRSDEALELEAGDRLARPLDRLGDRQPEVHRPERDLLEHRRRDPGALGVRVLEADDDALGELVGRRPAVGSPSSVSVPVRLPPIDAGARPDATRQSVDLPASFGPTSPTISPSSRRRDRTS